MFVTDLSDLQRKHAELMVDVGGLLKLTPELKKRVASFILELAAKFDDNTNEVSSNPRHPRVARLQAENVELSKMRRFWEARV